MHTWLQPPQLLGSRYVSTQPELQHSPTEPVGRWQASPVCWTPQVGTPQPPETQVSPPGQWKPHWPQLSGAVYVSTQADVQHVPEPPPSAAQGSSWSEVVQVRAVQVPLTQVSPE